MGLQYMLPACSHPRPPPETLRSIYIIQIAYIMYILVIIGDKGPCTRRFNGRAEFSSGRERDSNACRKAQYVWRCKTAQKTKALLNMDTVRTILREQITSCWPVANRLQTMGRHTRHDGRQNTERNTEPRMRGDIDVDCE